jgi:hypothetical protein
MAGLTMERVYHRLRAYVSHADLAQIDLRKIGPGEDTYIRATRPMQTCADPSDV